MMHECPKCGFVQPKDRYCANCGLDIDSYRPAPVPVWTRIKRNTVVQVSLVIIVVFAIAIFIYISQRERITNDLVAPITKPFTTNQTHLTSRSTKADATKTAETSTTAPQPIATATVTEKTTTQVANPIIPKKLSIRFLEVTKNIIQQLETDGQIINETGQTKSIAIQNTDILIKARDVNHELNSLPGGDTQTLNPGTPLTFDFTHMASGTSEDIGMNLLITPSAISATSVDLDLSLSLHLKNETGSPVAESVTNASYSFSPKSTLILIGFLPNQSIRQKDQGSFSNTPLEIYNSPNFIGGGTDFVIMIQAQP